MSTDMNETPTLPPCPSESLFLAYVRCHLSSDERETIERHVDVCVVCQRREEAYQHDQEYQQEQAEGRTSTPEFSEGQRIANRYRVVRLLGDEGFGTAYLATDDANQRVVLKFQKPEVAAAYPIEVEHRFLDRMSHRGIVKALGLVVHGDGRQVLVTQFIEGDELANLIPKGGVGLDRALDLIRGIAEPLAHIHANKAIHCDLKPRNIIVDEASQQPVLIDLGIAAHAESSKIQTAGTPGYTAPERYTGHGCDVRADVWSLGVIFYQLLVGAHPFKNPRAPSFDLKKAPVPPSSLNSSIPSRVSNLCLACLEDNPRKRPNDARDFLSRLPRPREPRLGAALATFVLILLLLASHEWIAAFVLSEARVPRQTREVVERIVGEEWEAYQSGSPGNAANFDELLLHQNGDFKSGILSLKDEGCQFLLAYAPAGSGKSSMYDSIIKNLIPDRSIVTIKLEKFVREASEPRMGVDLTLRKDVINRLPILDADKAVLLLDRIRQNPGALVILDSVDELHQDALGTIAALLRKHQGSLYESNIDVLMYTRPEVVDIAIKRDNAEGILAGIPRIGLKPHRIPRSALRLRVRNYLDYLRTKPDPRVKGLDDAFVDRITGRLESELASYPFLVDTLRIPMNNKLIMDSILDEAPLGRDEPSIKRRVLERALARNMTSHNRPNETGSSYLLALSEIAFRCSPAADGEFVVPLELVFSDGSGEVFTPYDVLQRSGLVSLVPANGNARMRFEPIWLHTELAAHSGLLDRGEVFRRCALLVLGGALLWIAMFFVATSFLQRRSRYPALPGLG